MSRRYAPRKPHAALVPTRSTTPAILTGPAGATLSALVPRFLSWLQHIRRRSPNTVAAYAFDLRRFLEFCDKASIERPEHVTFREVETYIGWLQHEGAKASTANRHRYALITFWRWLRRDGVATGDPVADTFKMKEPARLPVYLAIPEQERVMEVLGRDETLRGRRDHAVVAVGLFAGLRAEELVTLKVHDVNLEAGVLRVVGKGDKERELPIVPRLAATLRPYLTETRPALVTRPVGELVRIPNSPNWHARFWRDGRHVMRTTGTRDKQDARAFLIREGEQPPEVPWLFVNASKWNNHRLRRGGQALLTRTLFHVVRNKVGAIVGRPVSPHVLRHSFASRLRENEAPLELIQEALGHGSINTTMIYAHISTAKRKADLAKFLE